MRRLIVNFIAISLLWVTAALPATISGFFKQALPSSTPISAGVSFASMSSPLFAAPSASLNFSAPFSVVTRIKGTTAFTSSFDVMGSNNTGATLGWQFYNYASDGEGYYLRFALYPGSNGVCSTMPCIRPAWYNDGNTHIIIGTYDGTTSSIYVDGVLRDTTSTTFTNANTFFQLGAASTAITYYNTEIYSRVLTSTEIAIDNALMAQGNVATSGSLTTGLVADWALNNCTTCTDSSGNGNTLSPDSTPPTVVVTVPSSGATLSGSGNTLTATCSDSVACVSVQFQVDGVNIGSAITSSPWTLSTFDTSKMVDSSSHQVVAIGTNAGGLPTTSAAVAFTTSNGITNKNYYFATAGSDSANCTSPATACQTITKVNSLTLHEGDTVNFNKGDTFTGCPVFDTATNFAGLGGATFPLVVGAYGTGANPIIQSNCGSTTVKSGLFTHNGISGFTVQDLTLHAASSPATEWGLHLSSTHGVTATGITVQRLDVSGATATIIGEYGVEIFYSADSSSIPLLNNVSILNNTLHGTSVSATDDCGVCGYGNSAGSTGKFNNQNFTVQGNVVYNIGGNTNSPLGTAGNGLICNGVTNCTMQFNVAHDNGYNITACGGPAGIWTVHSQNTTIQFNEVYHQTMQTLTSSACDQAGIDLDGGVTGAIVQFNYLHDNAGPGIETCAHCAGFSYWGPNTIRFNVTENNNLYGRGDQGEISLGSKCSSGCGYLAYVYGNTTWSKNGFPDIAFQTNGRFGTGSVIADNIFAQAGSTGGLAIFYADNHVGTGNTTILNNDWYNAGAGTPDWTWNGNPNSSLSAWSSASGGAINVAGSITTNPALTSGGSGGTCYSSGVPTGPQPCPTAYNLSSPSTSPVRGVGLDLTQSPYSLSVGTRDYYGTTIPNGAGTGYNMGADQHSSLTCNGLDFSQACNSQFVANLPG